MNELSKRIAGEIGDKGAISFARFMELALYCPNYGYYEREKDIIGRRGDYFTSVSVGSLFGELLAFQFAAWLQPDKTQIVEAGAHGGDLARDILRWMREQRAELFTRLEYWIVEPSEARQRWQRQKLAPYGDKIRWVRDLAGLTGSAAGQIVFSNEFLDALPVHRLGWDAKAGAWFEWGVTLQDGAFAWCRMPSATYHHHLWPLAPHGPLTPALSPSAGERENPGQSAASGLLERLPDGFTIEICPAAEDWWRDAALALGRGKLLTIDYGLTAEEFFVPERKDGTVRSYHRHRPSGDVLAGPGEQDITAHVNFTAIRAAGEAAGLKTEAFQTQAQLLTGIAARTWNDEGAFGAWTTERVRQFQTLTHPEHLGRPFRALVQSR